MAAVREITGVDIGFWGPGAKLYGNDQGDYFLVIVSPAPPDEQSAGDRITFVPHPTMVFVVDENGMDRDISLKKDFPPLTTHEQALELAGHTLVTE